MSDSVNILKNMVSFDKSEQFDGFSKVLIIVSDEIEYSAGTDTGRTLTLNCPWGTQEVANNILQSIKGFQYQPMTANGALVDPSAEIGDGISANDVYSGIYSIDLTYNSNLPANVSAPADEEIDYEYEYKTKQEREIRRKFSDVQATFKIQSDLISAEVDERKSGDNELRASLQVQSDRITLESENRESDIKAVRSTLDVQANQITAKVNKNDGSSSTFGWALETASWRIFSGSNTVLKADKNGLEVKGVIRATSGEIGGFAITSNSLTYNNQTWGGTNTTGIYIGPNGIQLGNNFRVDNAGNLEAVSGTFSGYVKAGNIQYGDKSGYLSGYGIDSHTISGSRLEYNTVGSSYVSNGINAGVAGGNWATDVFNGNDTASYVKADYLVCYDNFNFQGVLVKFIKRTVMDSDGNPVTIRYLGNY